MRRALLAGLLLAAGDAAAHDGIDHATEAEAAAHRAEVAAALPGGPPTALPFDLGGPFDLIDQTGAARSEADSEGRLQLLFFGYANCPSICAVAMPLMAETVDLLAEAGIAAVPVMITVDPARDTVETMAAPLARLHPDFVGLTGDAGALAAARSAFGVDSQVVFENPEFGAVYAHGSHIFLMDASGEVLTLIPPILGAERARDIAARYAGAG